MNPDNLSESIHARVAVASGISEASVRAVLALDADGATVPFIARYRREATGGMDEVQVRAILKLAGDIADFDSRRKSILESLAERGLLTDDLKAMVMSADTRARLEDVYQPYRPKRRTRASMAVERGLRPLADRILAQPMTGDPAAEAVAFVNPEKGVEDAEAALAGARDIVAEAVSDSPEVRQYARKVMLDSGKVVSRVAPKVKAAGEPTPYEQYYEFSQAVVSIPSHRFLAVRRGANEGVLKMTLDVDEPVIMSRILTLARLNRRSPWSGQLETACVDAFGRLLFPAMENEVFGLLGGHCEREASEIFAGNLKDLLMSPPYGAKAVVGIDPGIRTGCKVAAVAATGAFVESTLIFPDRNPAQAGTELLRMVKRVSAAAVAVGNGTWGREAAAFARKVLTGAGMGDVMVVPVSESGASVYSASDVARDEFPDLDLTVRGAISIARRLQDPLAELVKVEPRSLGVGQYQHDVDPALLAARLDEVVEDCVNAVGVDLNTASAPLLSRVAGIGPALSKAIVKWRETAGPFAQRSQLLKVPRLGPATFTQCAGFLRIRDARNPLDSSAVHPERYGVVAEMARDLGRSVAELVGNAGLVSSINLSKYVDKGNEDAVDRLGMPTLVDIAAELTRPGRDPRSSFEAPAFKDDVREIEDLEVGMVLEGIVTNVAAFGAFVDIGVHQDGLVHVSELSDSFVRNPSDVVRTGQKVVVKVKEVDARRRRISLTMKGLRDVSRGDGE